MPAESSTSLDEIQQNFLVASNSLGMYPVYWDRDCCDNMSTNCCLKEIRSQITSQFGPRDRCDIMSTNCCSLKGNWIPNHIIVWTKGSLRHHVDELLLRRQRQDLKSDRCLDRGIVAFVVLNTKLDAMHEDFMSRVVDDRRQQDSKI